MDLVTIDMDAQKVVIESSYDGQSVALSDEEHIHSCSPGLSVGSSFTLS